MNNLELYKTFYYVAKAGSITAAAQQLSLTQPAVSQSMKQLEAQLNVSLFQRTAKGIRLTKEGEILFPYAESCCESIRQGEQKLKEGDEITQRIEAKNDDWLLFFTNQQQVYKCRAGDFEDTKASVMGDFVPSRLGFDEGEFTAVEFCRRMEGEGAAAITLHGRTRAQGYSGLADRDKIATVKEAVGIPLIGNGDVNAATVDDMLSRTDAAAVGRAAVGNPYIFAQILGKPVRESVRDLVLRHIELSYRYYGDRYTFVNIRKHLGAYLGGVRGGKEIRIKLFSATSVEELVELVKLYFPSDER